MNWIVQTYAFNREAKTGRWITYRHRDGSKAIARFETLGALRRFAKHHCLTLGQPCRALNEVTKEYQTL